MYIKVIGLEVVDWIHLTEEVRNITGFIKGGKFLVQLTHYQILKETASLS
jgi:hypothetical protein